MRQSSWFRKVPFADDDGDDDDGENDEVRWFVRVCKFLSFVALRVVEPREIWGRSPGGGHLLTLQIGSLTAIDSTSVMTLSHNVGVTNLLTAHHLLPSFRQSQSTILNMINKYCLRLAARVGVLGSLGLVFFLLILTTTLLQRR